MTRYKPEIFIIAYRDIRLITSIQIGEITIFNMELLMDDKRVPLPDYSNILALVIDRYQSELFKLSKRMSKRYNLSIDNLSYYLTFRTVPSREIVLIDKFNNKSLLRSVINAREFVTFIDSGINDKLFDIHNINIHFINAILHQKIKKFISNIRLASSLIRLLIILTIFLSINMLDPLQSLDLIIREAIYSLTFIMYPFIKPISNFIIRKLLNYLIARVIKRDR